MSLIPYPLKLEPRYVKKPWGGRRIEGQVRSIDIMPTLLELLELPVPAELDGTSLIPFIETGRQQPADREAISYAAASNHGISLREGNRYKYHFRNSAWISEESTELFFDLTQDPQEQRPLPALDATADAVGFVFFHKSFFDKH